MKRFFSSVILAAFISVTAPAFADYSTVNTSTIPLYPSIPAAPCGVAPWCASAQLYITAYNSYVHTLNQVSDLARQAQTYARYPQSAATNFQSMSNSVAQILQQSQGLSYGTQGIDQQLQAVWPNYSPGTPLSTLNGVLEQNTASGILAVLKSAGVINQADNDTSMSGAIAAIRTAGAQAVNPTQASQLTVQMLTLIWEQLNKQSKLTALHLSEAAQYDMQRVSSERQQRLRDEAIVEDLQASASGLPPTITAGQAARLIPQSSP